MVHKVNDVLGIDYPVEVGISTFEITKIAWDNGYVWGIALD